MFGRKDLALASDAVIDRRRTQFPDATHIDLPKAGHYAQEDEPDKIIGAVRATFG
jgi:haloalkane dehalogenase